MVFNNSGHTSTIYFEFTFFSTTGENISAILVVYPLCATTKFLVDLLREYLSQHPHQFGTIPSKQNSCLVHYQ